MDDSSAPNIQNEYFNQVRREKTRVAVTLNSGRRLTGRIRSFDKFTVLLESSQGEQIIFKHAIAIVGPSTAAPGTRARGGFSNRMQVASKDTPSQPTPSSGPADDDSKPATAGASPGGGDAGETSSQA